MVKKNHNNIQLYFKEKDNGSIGDTNDRDILTLIVTKKYNANDDDAAAAADDTCSVSDNNDTDSEEECPLLCDRCGSDKDRDNEKEENNTD